MAPELTGGDGKERRTEERVDRRIERIDARCDGLQRMMWQGFAWVVGLQVTFFLATIGFVAAWT